MSIDKITTGQAGVVGIVTGASGTVSSVWNILTGAGQYMLLVVSFIAAVMGCYITYPKFRAEWDRRGGWASLNPWRKSND